MIGRSGLGTVAARLTAQERRIAFALVSLATQGALDGRSGERKVHFLAFNRLTLAGSVDVGLEQGWKAVKAASPAGECRRQVASVLSGLRTTLDGNHSTVHVHLAVSNLVEPRPGQEGLARRGVRGNLKVILGGERASSEH